MSCITLCSRFLFLMVAIATVSTSNAFAQTDKPTPEQILNLPTLKYSDAKKSIKSILHRFARKPVVEVFGEHGTLLERRELEEFLWGYFFSQFGAGVETNSYMEINVISKTYIRAQYHPIVEGFELQGISMHDYIFELHDLDSQEALERTNMIKKFFFKDATVKVYGQFGTLVETLSLDAFLKAIQRGRFQGNKALGSEYYFKKMEQNEVILQRIVIQSPRA